MSPDKRLLLQIYKSLFKKYGPQRWWPARTPFEVMVGAVLTQNTNWSNVEKAIANIRRARVLHPQKLYDLPVRELAALIKPSGYFNIKAKRLRNYLKFFLDTYGGSVARTRKVDTSTLREQLLGVNGVGPETADSILLYALGRPVFVVDAYTRRFLFRHGMIKGPETYSDIQAIFESNLTKTQRHKAQAAKHTTKSKSDVPALCTCDLCIVPGYNEFHALIVRLGVENCRPKAQCETCPLRDLPPPFGFRGRLTGKQAGLSTPRNKRPISRVSRGSARDARRVKPPSF